MRKTNYHMYTRRCMHTSGRDEEYVVSAIENGYEEIGFSDHSPWNYDSDSVANMWMSLSKPDDYYASVSSLKKKYKNHMSIKISLECEYFLKHIDWLKQFLIDRKLDYIISGNHYFKMDEERVRPGTVCEEEAWLTAYVDEAIAGMKTNLYSYLCHPDLFTRGRRVSGEATKRESTRLCRVAKELHMPLEYNLAGAAYNGIMRTMQYPHINFWKTAAEVGSTAIIGADVHESVVLEINSHREESIALLPGLGMKITDTLSSRGLTSYE